MNQEVYKTKISEVYKRVKEGNAEPVGLTNEQKEKVRNIVDNAEDLKAVVSVIITSLLKKIISPTQDVRKHQENMDGGYSGRVLDTNIVTPFMKEYYNRFAMAESGWLTRSLEQNVPYNENYTGKIRNSTVKTNFLSIFNDLEVENIKPIYYLEYFFHLMNIQVEEDLNSYNELKGVDISGVLSIPLIIDMLREHFAQPLSARLPVLAIYSIYQIIINNVERYKNKKLDALKSHTTADRYTGFGDIELFDEQGDEFEGVEIKHEIPISIIMIQTVIEKIKDRPIEKYYILTTAEPNFADDIKEINDLVLRIKTQYDIDLTPNGIFPTLKYYLRLIDDYNEFLKLYSTLLLEEYEKNTDVKAHHIKAWKDILKNHQITT